ncbi:hypothetical protein [Halomonas colorata]|uniref:hypothetical protein n=1 Tax=Halomonas colorata TaxID=2742615 RepID=UPI00186646B6|nr:hypothetical protein [Halomonas colorata]
MADFDPASEPLGTADPRVRDLNTRNLDRGVNSSEMKWVNRFGEEQATLRAGSIASQEVVDTAAQAKQNIEEQVDGLRDEVDGRLNGILIAGGRIFDSEAQGRAAVSNDQYFYAASDDPNVSKTLWQRVNSSSSRFIADDPSAEFIAGIESAQYVAIDKASEPDVLSGEFYNGDDEFVPVITDSQGNSLFALDENGFPIAALGGEFYGDSDGFEWDFAALNAEGEIIYATLDGRVVDRWGYEFYNSDETAAELSFVDESGKQLLAWDESGEPLNQGVTSGEQPLIPYHSDDMIFGMGATAKALASVEGFEVFALSPGNDRHVRAVIDSPMIDAKRTVAAGGGLLIPDCNRTLHARIGIGQSLVVGATAAPTLVSIDPIFPDEALMFESGANSDVRMGLETQGEQPVLDPRSLTGFAPLVARVGQGPGSRGETIMESSANELTRQARELGASFRSLSFTAGQGATNYQGLKKGSQVYENMLEAIQRAVDLAAEKGWRLVVDACVLKHGEADNTNANYFNDLIEWQNDIDADVKAITGQAGDVPFLMAQPSSFYSAFDSVIAMVKANNESPRHHLTGPDYPFSDEYFTDLLHFKGPGYYLIGEQVARAHKQALWSSAKTSRIIEIIGANIAGTVATVSLSVPTPPLVIDTTTVRAQVNHGFNVYDDAGELGVTDVRITDDGSSNGIAIVELTLSDSSSGQGERVDYALVGHSGTRSVDTIPRGNIRDSAKDVSSLDGRPLYNWAVHQRFTIN